jgi:hypothetical protein
MNRGQRRAGAILPAAPQAGVNPGLSVCVTPK